MLGSVLKKSKKLLVGAVLMVGCLGMAAVCSAEAKAIEFDKILKASYAHAMRNEFYIRNANMYKDPVNGWGEITAREESGMDGSVTLTWLIGDVNDGPGGDVLFNVKRQVVKKMDGSGKTLSWKYDDVNYGLLIYPQDEYSFKLVKPEGGRVPKLDIEGDYGSTVEYPLMSTEAARYVLARFMNKLPAYRAKLQGAGMQHSGMALAEKHEFKLVEQHPTHVVTRGTYEVSSDGSIREYDVVMDRWTVLTGK